MGLAVAQLGTASAVSGSTTLALTTTASAPAGSLIVVVGAVTAGPNLTGVADTAGNSYVVGAQFGNGVGKQRWFWSFLTSPLGLGATITLTFATAAGTKLMGAVNVTGQAARDLQGAGALGTGAAPSLATATLGWPNEIVFAACDISAGAADSFTEAAGFTGNTPILLTDALRWAYQITTSNAAVTYAPTLGASRTWGVNTLTFSGAVASPFNRTDQFTYLGM